MSSNKIEQRNEKGQFIKGSIPINKGKKMTEEYKKHLSEKLKGRKVWNTGKTKEEYPQLSNSGRKKGFISWRKGKITYYIKNCLNCDNEFKVVDNRRKFCSHLCADKYNNKIKIGKERIDMVGENNHSWKGGITPLYLKIRHSHKYNKWRSNIFERDKWICQTCNERKQILHAHHIKEFKKIIEENNIKTFDEAMGCKELWDVNNGVTLCVDCHNLTRQFNGGDDNL